MLNIRSRLLTLVFLGAIALAGCGGDSGSEPFQASGSLASQKLGKTLASLQVTPAQSTIPNGTQAQLTAIGTFSDGTNGDLTSWVEWSSADPSVATVAPGGTASAVTPGSSTITATLEGVSAPATVVVSDATIVSIAVDPPSPLLAAGTTQQLTATATLSDGSSQDVTASADWHSASPTVATVDNTGMSSALQPGQSEMTASAGGVAGTTILGVSQATATSLQITPAGQTLANGTTLQYTAVATFSDGSTQDVTSSSQWSSSATANATISAQGLASAHGPGTTEISASFAGVTDDTDLTISPAVVASIAVTPSVQSIADGTTVPFTATATLTDGSLQDVTATASWSSSSSATATIDTTGLATAVDPGQTSITATTSNVSGSATLVVTDATVTSITVTPAGMTLADGLTLQYAASATFSDGSIQNVTSGAQWFSSDMARATIAPGGLATAASPGATSISASFGGQSGSTGLTVSAATIASITVTPGAPAIADGMTQLFTATATLTDGTAQDVTASADWSSATPATATINTAGLATAVDTGQSIISATAGGISGSATLTVTNATITGLAVDPATALSAPGSSRQYRALATLSDGTTEDVTSQVVWSSGDPLLTIANDNQGGNKIGLAHISGAATSGQLLTVTATLGASSADGSLRLGSFLYCPNFMGDDVSVFTINTVDGSLTAGTSVPGGLVPSGADVHPNGRFLYTTAQNSNQVRRYSIDPMTGGLGFLDFVTNGNGPRGIKVHPNGRFLYSANGFSDNVGIFTVNPTTGAIAAAGTAAAGDQPLELTIDPSGRFLYVSCANTDSISVFTINQSTGQLTAGAAVAAGMDPFGLTVSPDGRFLYVANFGSDNISIYDIDPTTGALTATLTATAGNEVSTVALHSSGLFAYAPNRTSDNLSTYTVTPFSGALTGPVNVAAGDGARAAVIDPSGRFLYIGNSIGNTISAFSINQATGGLTAGATISGGTGPRTLAVTP